MKSTPTQVPSASKADFLLDKEQMTDRIITAKVKKQLSWTSIAEKIGVNEVWLASACLGMNSMKQTLQKSSAPFWNYLRKLKRP